MRTGTLLFLHIPKTGGTTLYRILGSQYSGEELFRFEAEFPEESLSRLAGLTPAERFRFRCLVGHMPFGLHEHLAPPTVYVTLLRDPLERVLSHYYYVLRRPDHRLHAAIVSRNISPAEYVDRDLAPELQDGQTRMISGFSSVAPLPQEALEIAKANLEQHFAVAGLTERFDEALLLMQRRLGWRNVYYVRKNVSADRPIGRSISPDARQAILAKNPLDQALHRHAGERLERQVREAGPMFQLDLHRFRLLNRLYNLALAGYRATRTRLAMVK